MTIEALTERESQALEHLQKAQELEVSLAEYARSFSVDVKELYSAKQALQRKGVLAARAAGEESEEAQLGDFVAVQVVTPTAAPTPTSVCRICHPSGLVIECSSWPPAAWWN